MLRIGIDIDETIAGWNIKYEEYFNTKKYPHRLKEVNLLRNIARKLVFDKSFWIDIPVIRRCNFEPELYCTIRTCKKAWTKEWLAKNNFPKRPVYQTFGNFDKGRFIKGRVDVFIDDNISNFIKLNKQGIPCLLIDSPYNQEWGPVGRIYSLDIDEIEEAYNLLHDHNRIYSN